MVTYADILMDVLSKKNPTSIIRISWLYSSFGNNFLTKVINVIQDSDEIKVVDEQFGSSIYACDLANTFLFLIKNQKWYSGIYNYTNSGDIFCYLGNKEWLEKIISRKVRINLILKFFKLLLYF